MYVLTYVKYKIYCAINTSFVLYNYSKHNFASLLVFCPHQPPEAK